MGAVLPRSDFVPVKQPPRRGQAFPHLIIHFSIADVAGMQRITPSNKKRGTMVPRFLMDHFLIPLWPRRERASKVKLQSKLDLPRSLCTRDPTQVWANRAIFEIESGCVGQVDKLRAELDTVAFGQEEVFLKTQV